MSLRVRLTAVVFAAALLTGCSHAGLADRLSVTDEVPPKSTDSHTRLDPMASFGEPVEAQMELPGGRLLLVGPVNGSGLRPVGLVAGGSVVARLQVPLAGTGVKLAQRDLPGHAGALVLEAHREQGEPLYAALSAVQDQLQPVDYYAVIAPAPESGKGTSIHVNKHLNRLWLFQDGKLVKHYPVATGRQVNGPPPTVHDYQTNYFTPEGRFTIDQKIVNPPYYGSASHPAAAGGAPDNPLGTRWMGFVAVKGLGPEVWGIHGTDEPERIGTWASDGCVRMAVPDAEELFAQVPTGAVLRITESLPG